MPQRHANMQHVVFVIPSIGAVLPACVVAGRWLEWSHRVDGILPTAESRDQGEIRELPVVATPIG
jgi:hypothetical protein